MKTFFKLLLTAAAVGGLIYGVQYLPMSITKVSADQVDYGSGDFAFAGTNSDGSPVTWDTCKPIDVLVETVGMPAGADAEVEEAVSRLSKATDLNLNYLGTVGGMHSQDWVADSRLQYPDQPPILIGWTRRTADMPSDDTVGFALTEHTTQRKEGQISGSVITLHTKRLQRLGAGFPKGDSRGAVYMHEIAHALGLDHVPNSNQLMYEMINQFNGELGEGDVAGLNALALKMCPSP